MAQLNPIEPKKYYNCYEIAQLGFIPHIKNKWQMARLARADKMTNNYLDAVVVPRGEHGVQYQIRGANIIKYLVNNE